MRIAPLILFLCVLSGEVRFTDVTEPGGLSATLHGEGVCVFDFDKDGLEDIAIADYDGDNLLYRNLGDMTFQEVSQESGIVRGMKSRLVVAGDYDNDGYPDLFVGAIDQPSVLHRNNGDGTFSDVTTEAGIYTTGDVRGGAWCDVNRDGLLDLYVAFLKDENLLCQNNGDGTFTEVAVSLNARGPSTAGLVMGLAFLDFDLDGDDDLFMTQDGNKGNVLLRWDAPGSYTDVSQSAGVKLAVQGMGVAVGDYDRDGLFDVYTTNFDENTLLKNVGDGTFQDVSQTAGVQDESQSMSWGTFFLDADNDGWLDLFSHNQTGFGQVPNSFFLNNKDGTFKELSAEAGLETWNDGIGSAFGDLDNDGDLDIVLAGGPVDGKSLNLFRNESAAAGWIQVSLEGTVSNRSGVGSVVEVHTPAGLQTSFVAAGNGYASQNSLRLHFGLGELAQVDSLVVRWPSGTSENFGSLAENEHHVLVEGSGASSVGVVDPVSALPSRIELFHPYPNPFNETAVIPFSIPRRAEVEIAILDVRGRTVEILSKGGRNEGSHRITWRSGNVPSGIYVVRMTVGDRSLSRKILLLK